MADSSNRRSAIAVVAAAALAGILAGAVAVYVTNRSPGNDPETAAVPAGGACSAALANAGTVGDAATGDVAAMLAATEPVELSSLAFKGSDGGEMTLGDFSGKTVLFNLWATWCVPCREEMPALDALQKSKGGDRFQVVAVNIDHGSEDKPRKFLDETGVEALSFYRDETMGVFNELKRRALALGLPVTLLVDGEGCLLANMNGPADWSGDDAARLIDAAMGG